MLSSAPWLQAGPGPFGLILTFFVIIIIVVAVARGLGGSSRVQRPISDQTAFPPPPPPDSVMVKCQYCGTSQRFSKACMNCGAPLPKPVFPS
ncbi:MAG: hypothetical protein HY247_06290 [archaeon]|nr:MAG: hypothetical protein HY247_06290 [archaeon]